MLIFLLCSVQIELLLEAVVWNSKDNGDKNNNNTDTARSNDDNHTININSNNNSSNSQLKNNKNNNYNIFNSDDSDNNRDNSSNNNDDDGVYQINDKAQIDTQTSQNIAPTISSEFTASQQQQPQPSTLSCYNAPTAAMPSHFYSMIPQYELQQQHQQQLQQQLQQQQPQQLNVKQSSR